MTTWTSDELERIGTAEELEIAPLQHDGTLREAVPIWVVRVNDALYVRCVKGRSGPWFRAVLERHAGRIEAGGVVKNVTFVEETNPRINEQISDAYRTKYSDQPIEYVDPTVTPDARTATLRLDPQ